MKTSGARPATAPTGQGGRLPARAPSATAAPAPTPTFTPTRQEVRPRAALRRAAPGPGTYASAELRPDPAAAAQARRLIRETLIRWDLHEVADDAAAIASEIVANAITAATPARGTLPAVIFAVHHSAGELRISVWDNGPGQPAQTNPGPDAEHGRGLTIIDDLTRGNWGWWPTPFSQGKCVWAALPTPENAS